MNGNAMLTPTSFLCVQKESQRTMVIRRWSGKLELNLQTMTKSHSWVRISHGLYKLVTVLTDKEQETSEMKSAEFSFKTNVLAFASHSKAKAKTTKTYFCLLIYKNCTYL